MLLKDNKAQISAEIIIIMAALLAVALIFISSLKSTSKAADTKLEKTSKEAIKEVGKIK